MQRKVATCATLWLLLAAPALAQSAPADGASTPASTPGIDTSDNDRRRTGQQPQPEALPPVDPTAVPPPEPMLPRETLPIPDRWRLIDAVGMQTHWWDPYNQNTLKGDRPVFGNDWFVNVSAISDTLYEMHGVPTPVADQGDVQSGLVDPFGRSKGTLFSQSVITSVSLIQGDTAYKPPDVEIRLTPVFNFNSAHAQDDGVLEVNPALGTTRNDDHLGLQEAFVDYHIRDVSDRYDFDSIRVGIQPVTLDFRGFLFEDQQLGVRLFGNRDNNLWQYNVGWFRLLEKDTNSGLNDLTKKPRNDDVYFVNLYRQDAPVHGYTLQGTVVYNRDREGNEAPFYDDNGFLVRPAPIGVERPTNYDAVYIGFNGDGHFGWLNLTHSFYGVVGDISANPFTSITHDQRATIRAGFGAIEPSVDFDWIRVRLQALYATGDRNPYDNKATGFDAIMENPQFAGADTSYWIRQSVPLIGGGGVGLSGRDGILIDLRSSKDQGQSNFINPGTVLFGGGADFDVAPPLRISFNVNHISMATTEVIEALRDETLNSTDIGWDTSVAFTYRPTFIQNVVFRASAATLFGGQAFRELFAVSDNEAARFYSVLFNLVLTY